MSCWPQQCSRHLDRILASLLCRMQTAPKRPLGHVAAIEAQNSSAKAQANAEPVKGKVIQSCTYSNNVFYKAYNAGGSQIKYGILFII